MYHLYSISSFLTALMLCIQTAGHDVHLHKHTSRELSTSLTSDPSLNQTSGNGTETNPHDDSPSTNVSLTLGARGRWFYRRGAYTVEFMDFQRPLIAYHHVALFVASAHINLERRRLAQHKEPWDSIGPEGDTPAFYDYTSTRDHISFNIREDYKHIGRLAYDLIDIVLQGIRTLADRDKENGVAPVSFILWRRSEYLADGEFEGPPHHGLAQNVPPVGAVNLSTTLGQDDDWSYESGRYRVLLYDFHTPILPKKQVIDAATLAITRLRHEQAGRADRTGIPSGHWFDSTHGISIHIEQADRWAGPPLNYGDCAVILQAIKAYARSHPQTLEADIIVHSVGTERAAGLLRRDPGPPPLQQTLSNNDSSLTSGTSMWAYSQGSFVSRFENLHGPTTPKATAEQSIREASERFKKQRIGHADSANVPGGQFSHTSNGLAIQITGGDDASLTFHATSFVLQAMERFANRPGDLMQADIMLRDYGRHAARASLKSVSSEQAAVASA